MEVKVDTGYKGVVNQFRFTETNKVVKEVADCILHRWETLLGDRKQLPLIDDKQIFNRIKRIYEKGIDYLKMDIQ